jgi:hypothetical protein
MKKSQVLLFGLCLAGTAYPGRFAAAEAPALSADTVLARIIEREQQFHDMQASAKWSEFDDQGEQVLYDYTWGYSQGREFLNGTWWAYDQQPPVTIKKIHAFDGEKQYNFGYVDKAPFPTGGIYPLDPAIFNSTFSPKALLGYATKSNGHETFGAILSQAGTLRRADRSESLKGHACVVLEAKQIRDGEMTYDVRAWIDPQRGYLPLKIEKYRSANGPNEWKVIDQRFENIELAQIDGTWFPVQGETCTYYIKDILPPAGMTEEQCAGFSDEEARDRLQFITAPITKKRRLVVVPDSVRLNKGIPLESFRITFPMDCRVWDDFSKLGYVVGAYMNDQRALDALGAQNADADKAKGTSPASGDQDAPRGDLRAASDRHPDGASRTAKSGTVPGTAAGASAARPWAHGILRGVSLVVVLAAAAVGVGIVCGRRHCQAGPRGRDDTSEMPR